MKKQISQPRPQRFRYRPDITRTFARYLGRRLSAPERRIISALEAKRLKGEPARFLIIDSPQFDARPILIRYQAWRALGGQDAMLVAPRKTDAIKLLSEVRVPNPPKAYHATWLNSIRGATYWHALAVDAHLMSTRALFPVIAPIIPLAGTTTFIIHSRAIVPIPPAYERPPDAPPDIGIKNLTDPPKVIIIELKTSDLITLTSDLITLTSDLITLTSDFSHFVQR